MGLNARRKKTPVLAVLVPNVYFNRVQSAESKRNLTAWLAAFFLAALGAKLWTIQLWTTNLPYWDQWDEARLLFKPWLEGTLTWHDFFIPHNEHRIVFTRLLDLLEVKLNGQWDIYLQTVVNAGLHLAFGCGLAAVIWDFTGRKYAGLICFLLLPFFALPFAAENTVHGFQSQFYFANIFSVAAILGLGFGKPCGQVWFGGLLAAALAIFTMASGFLAAAAVVGLMILRVVKQRGVSRGEILTALGGLAVVAFGLAVKVEVAQHAQLKAHSFGDFFGILLQNLAWPFGNAPVLAAVVCAPVALVAVKFFRGGFKEPRAAEFVLALAGWSFLQALVLAYGRARIVESSRYFDALSMLPLINGAALFVLAAENDFSGRVKKCALPLALLWSVLLVFGLVQSARAVAANYLIGERAWGLAQVDTVRAFLATGDAAVMEHAAKPAVPHWSAVPVMEVLRQPKIVGIFPRDAFPPASPRATTGRFSAAALWVVDRAVPVLCGGLILCALLAAGALRRPGNSIRNEGLAWMCVLIIAATAAIGAAAGHDVDRTSYAASLHKQLAVAYANSGRMADAALHLHEALQLQPGDESARKALEVLEPANPPPTEPARPASP